MNDDLTYRLRAARLRAALNAESAENGSDTPDYLLADFLAGVLDALNTTIKKRDRWHGFTPWVPKLRVADEDRLTAVLIGHRMTPESVCTCGYTYQLGESIVEHRAKQVLSSQWFREVCARIWDEGAEAQAKAYGMDKDTGPNPYIEGGR